MVRLIGFVRFFAAGIERGARTSLYYHNWVCYRASAKWAAFTGSCSSRRSSWFARAVQLLAMLRMITSD